MPNARISIVDGVEFAVGRVAPVVFTGAVAVVAVAVWLAIAPANGGVGITYKVLDDVELTS